MIFKHNNLNNYFKRIMAIGPHPDDIELGCFGSLARFKKEGAKIAFVVLGVGGKEKIVQIRKKEASKSANLLDAKLFFGDFVDTRIPEGIETISFIERCINDFKPTSIFINSPNDTHQDHRNTAKAAISASRFIPVVLFYQTPSSTRFFDPKVYIDITDYIKLKIRAVRIHKTQGKNVYMADEAVLGQAKFLGLQIYRGGQYFEGFEVHQLIL
jgi:LmbE family N-acetylglucosaminyl deacetylase